MKSTSASFAVARCNGPKMSATRCDLSMVSHKILTGVTSLGGTNVPCIDRNSAAFCRAAPVARSCLRCSIVPGSRHTRARRCTRTQKS